MRFKPPPPNSPIGWRVEFRPMEVCNTWSTAYTHTPVYAPFLSFYTIHFYSLFLSFQLQITDFENAAFVVFIVLMTRAILSFKLNFLIPISKVCPDIKQTQSYLNDVVPSARKMYMYKERM